MTQDETFRFMNALQPGMVDRFIEQRKTGRAGVLCFGDFGTHEVRMAAWLCKDTTMIAALDVGFHDLNLAALEKLISPKEVATTNKVRRDELVDIIQKRYLKMLSPDLPAGIYDYPYQEIMSKLAQVEEYKSTVNVWKNYFKKRRTVAKESTFGPLFGMEPPTFAGAHGITLEEAEEVFRIDRETYPIKHAYFDERRKRMRKDGFVQSIFGKRRLLDYAGARGDDGATKALDRQGTNTIVQGPSSDLGYLCMWECMKRFKAEKVRALPIGTVHDSLGHDSHPDCYLDVLQITFETMENHPSKLLGSDHVKFKAEMEYMTDWGHPKPWEPAECPF